MPVPGMPAFGACLAARAIGPVESPRRISDALAREVDARAGARLDAERVQSDPAGSMLRVHDRSVPDGTFCYGA